MVTFFGACATFLGEVRLFLSVKSHLMKWQVELMRRQGGQAAVSKEQPKRSSDGSGTSPREGSGCASARLCARPRDQLLPANAGGGGTFLDDICLMLSIITIL